MRASLPVLLLLSCAQAQPAGTGAIVAPDDGWTFVEFDDARCANGSTTGLAINPSARATDVVIYLMGGGACWDEASCYTLDLAWNVEKGYGANDFALETLRSATLFDRRNGPFKDAAYVFVPYCTGDLHAGTSEQTYGGRRTLHVGAKNLDAYLARLKPTFAGAQRIFVAGTSAGGFGAQLNAARFVDAFAPLPVHVLADSAALVNPQGTRWSQWFTAWQPQAPEGCAACADDATAWVGAARTKLGAGRMGVITADEDLVISAFTGLSTGEFKAQTTALVDAELRTANASAFIVPGTRHTFVTSLGGVSARDGTALTDWLAAFRSGEGFSTH